MIGRNDSIGPVASPNSPARLPSWKISVTTPNAPAIESRLKMPALIGISSERNTTASSSSESPTTTPMNSGSLSRIVWEKSRLGAVARLLDGLVGGLVLRRRRRVGDQRGRVAGLVDLRRQDLGDAVLTAQRL